MSTLDHEQFSGRPSAATIVEAVDWAASHGKGIGAVAERLGTTPIDALLEVLDVWAASPESFRRPRPVEPPRATSQCSYCGVWFADVAAHESAHEERARGRAQRDPGTSARAEGPGHPSAGTPRARLQQAREDRAREERAESSLGGNERLVPAAIEWAALANRAARQGDDPRERTADPEADFTSVPEAVRDPEFARVVERAGLAAEYAALRDVIRDHLSLNDFRAVLATGSGKCSAVAKKLSTLPGYARDLGELLLSVPGHLEDDGERVQCHLCGLWMTSLAVHLSFHGIDSAEYRRRAGLAHDVPITSRARFIARTPEQIEQEWKPRVEPIGCTTMAEAAEWAAERGLGARGLARELSLTPNKVEEDFAAAGVAFISRSEQWRIRAELRSDPKDVLSVFQRALVGEAEQLVQEDGSLVHASGRLRTVLARWRAAAAAGRELAAFAFLDAADPGWRASPKERVDRGEFDNWGQAFRTEAMWRERMERVGWLGWSDAVRWAAAEHGAFAEIAQRLGCSEMSVAEKVKRFWEEPENLRAAEDLQLALPGEVYDDGAVVQCHVCGLWFKKVGVHCRVHGLDTATYQRRFGLGDARLSSTITHVRRADQGAEDVLQAKAAERNLERVEDLVSWALEHGLGMAELAKELEVSRGWLTDAFHDMGLAFPTVGEQMIVRARAEIAAGGNLSTPTDQDLRGWIKQLRSKRHRGLASNYYAVLDAVDPDWSLNEKARSERLGLDYRSPSSRKHDVFWEQRLRRAGWVSTAQAADWMVDLGASPVAVAVVMNVPVSTATARIRPAVPGYEVVGEVSGTPIEAPLRALLAHLRRGGTVETAPDPVRVWLEARANETRDRWVNRFLDEVAPGWRPENRSDYPPA
ncbi:hypothetical protein [Tsukamurella spumae]|uniref:ROS/MUCR transcriptional regulator protein n=1 Tax=Tsukamurella spumae TaxID=44753 RepID=A0A846X911_9ACTN|nr:hypothetical protein [Tsukamurella spumae]NKY20702.1 hypothetical protein [Tsukamurella spumae]